jgi:uncharacterized membrane protein
MEERVSHEIVVDAPREVCLQVVTDLEAYPEWADKVREVRVLDRDREGRPLRAYFRTAGFGRSTSYTLEYDYSGYPGAICWRLVEGDITTRLDGCYRFEEAGGGRTKVRYELEIGVRIPLPGFIKRRAESALVHIALDSFRRRAESLGRSVKKPG